MDITNFVQNIDLGNLQIDYTQMQIPFLHEILNSDFLGFNNLDFTFRIFLLLVITAISISITTKIVKYIDENLKKIFKFFHGKYEFFAEKNFNTLVSKQLNSQLKDLSSFIVVCGFEFPDKTIHPEIMSEFVRAFLINHKAKIKYDKNYLIFTFDDFYKIINSVITQLYITKTLFSKKYPFLKIYLSGTEIEKPEDNNKQIDLAKGLNKLRISSKYLICDSTFNFYYSLIKPQLYELQSNGEYLIQNETIETFMMMQPVDRTL
ncbi:hypothetical protein IJ818_04325 [bacterium]|nr:hypothetical protein [bacterium]